MYAGALFERNARIKTDFYCFSYVHKIFRRLAAVEDLRLLIKEPYR